MGGGIFLAGWSSNLYGTFVMAIIMGITDPFLAIFIEGKKIDILDPNKMGRISSLLISSRSFFSVISVLSLSALLKMWDSSQLFELIGMGMLVISFFLTIVLVRSRKAW